MATTDHAIAQENDRLKSDPTNRQPPPDNSAPESRPLSRLLDWVHTHRTPPTLANFCGAGPASLSLPWTSRRKPTGCVSSGGSAANR